MKGGFSLCLLMGFDFFIFRPKWQSVENVYYKLHTKSGRLITLSIIYLIPSFLVHCQKHNSYIYYKMCKLVDNVAFLWSEYAFII